jgi:hypothetical protein
MPPPLEGAPNVVPGYEDALLRDKVLLARLETLKAKIRAWEAKHDLYGPTSFKVPYQHRSAPPLLGDGLLLIADGADLGSMFRGDNSHWDPLETEFRELLASEGFWYELENGVTAMLIPEEDSLQEDLLKLFRWQWIQELAERRLYDVHSELFEFFARDPERLKLLAPRQFEEFLHSVFKNQGFHSEIGPGSGDGGIDHHLYQSESIPELVAVVQAKRYRDRPIGRDPVAALFGVAALKSVPRAIFATTSRYLPSAREFAANALEKLNLPNVELVDLQRIQEWCGTIAEQLDGYFDRGSLSLPPILANRKPTELTGKILTANKYGHNSFAVVEADFPHEVVLRSIGKRRVSGDDFLGTEVPDEGEAPRQHEPHRFLAFKNEGQFGPYYWTGQELYSEWDGKPQQFDMWD